MKCPAIITLLGVSFFVSACVGMCQKSHEDMTAEEVVQSYLDLAFNISDMSQKADLMEWTTGNLEAALAETSDDIFRQAYIERKYQLNRFSLVERRDRTPRETEITFQLDYRDLLTDGRSSSGSASVVTENTVAVIRERGLWKIRDVIGSKTTFDFPLSEDSRIEASPSSASDQE
ncbi:MAG: hypothetical protein H6618_03250 [Deltaproteobacteria bacterium]|nr:hypothetical protein [Deltaproteobacteria bacterium]